jgi:hypothetical protein
MSSRLRGSLRLLALPAIAALASTTLLDAAASAGANAHASRVLKATDDAQLRYIQSKSSGSYLFEEGSAGGTLPGTMRVDADIEAILTATFTIYARGGTIVGHATAKPHVSGIYESFAGSLVASGGTGSYTHAHGRAGFYGVLNRRTYAMTVQTTGDLSY